MPNGGGALFPNPVLYGLLALSILTNIVLIERRLQIDWHRFVHRDQPVPAVTTSDHVRGDPAAPVTIVEYADFQCPYCATFHEVMKAALERRPDVRWVYRHLPIAELHPLAVKAAEAAECASDEGKFWEYADIAFARQQGLDERELTTIARDVGLDERRFTACLQSGSKRARVEADEQAFPEGHLTVTPLSFVNGRRVEGAVPLEQIVTAIDAR